MIDQSFWIGEDGKRNFEQIPIVNRLFQGFSQDYKDLEPRFGKFIIVSTQLADMKTTLCSDVLSYKEQNDSLAAKIGYGNFFARSRLQLEFRYYSTYFQFSLCHFDLS
jgi:hypothetical protein